MAISISLRRCLPAIAGLAFLFSISGADAAVSVTDGKSLKAQQRKVAKAEAKLKGDRNKGRSLLKATGSQALIDSGGMKYFINTNITFSTSSSASGALSEASYTHAVAADTLNGGTVASTLNDAFDGYNTLCMSVNNTVATCQTGNANFVIYNKNGAASLDATCSNRQVLFPVQTVGNIQMSRKVFVPSNDQFVRHLNIFTNTGGAPQTVTAVISNNLGSDANTKLVATSNGGVAISNATTWVTSFQNWSGTTSSDPRLGFALQQTGAAVPLAGINFVDGDDNPFWGYTFSVPAGGTVIIANFTSPQPTRAAATAKATQLASGANGNMFNCMTSAEKIAVKNFNALAVPTISKAFGAATIPLQATTSLTVTITNPNASSLTGLAFTDTLPAGLVVATPNALANTCAGTVTATAGSGSVALSGGTVGASTSCTVTVNVQGTAAGTQNNTTGPVSSTETGAGAVSNTASVVVSPANPPTIAKAFGAATVPLNGSTSLTITITNGNVATLTALAFTDSLPAGLQVASPNALANTCGGTVTATANSSSVALTGGTMPGNSTCTVTVNVTGTSPGVKNNTTGVVSSNESGAGAASNTATITVFSPPTLTSFYGSPTIPLQGSTTLTFSLGNNNAGALPGASFTSTLPAGLVVSTPNGLTNTCGGTATATAGSTTISLTNGTVPALSACAVTVSVTGTTAGVKSNSPGPASATPSGPGAAGASASVTVVAPPTIAKSFGAATIPPQGTTSLTFTLANPNATVALSGVSFVDSLPAGLLVANPNGLSGSCGGGSIAATAGTGNVSLSTGTIAAGGQCSFSVNVVGATNGVKVNVTGAVSSANGGTGTTATATLGVIQTSFAGPTATGTGNATAALSTLNGGPNCGFTSAAFVPLSAAGAQPVSAVAFPHGLFQFTLGNCTAGFSATVTVTWPQALPAQTQYWDWGPLPANPAQPIWYVMPSGIAGNVTTTNYGDGSQGDDTIAAGGTIASLGGPAVNLQAQPIPTLSDWMLQLLAALLAVSAIFAIGSGVRKSARAERSRDGDRRRADGDRWD